MSSKRIHDRVRVIDAPAKPATPNKRAGNSSNPGPGVVERVPAPSRRRKPSVKAPALGAATPTERVPLTGPTSRGNQQLFTFTFDLRSNLPSVTQPPPSEAQVPPNINTVDESLEDVLLNHPSSGKGQNLMMTEWLNKRASIYLMRLLEYEGSAHHEAACAICHTVTNLFTCVDCYHRAVLCKDCLNRAHQFHPTHRRRKWTGTHFSPVDAREMDYTFFLGHSGQSCDVGDTRKFLLGHTNGFHKINVRFCRHPQSGDSPHQLLKAGIYPCSDDRPETGFTFQSLRQYHLLWTESKLSAQRFFNFIVLQTNNITPHNVPDRYREFLRCSHQWQLLQSLKRAGSSVVQPTLSPAGDLAGRCPACPRLGFNYQEEDVGEDESDLFVVHLNYDGSFQLFRKNKAYDRWDISLSEGRKYFVNRRDFDNYLNAVDAGGPVANTRDLSCNNHQAAQAGLVRFAGLDETGIGSVTCARHSFFMPTGTVNFKQGERYTHTDCAIAHVLRRLLNEGNNNVGLHYDIMCHYDRHMWTRFAQILDPPGAVSRDEFGTFIGAVGKFHLAGHTESCYVRYSLNHIQGVGRLDGEGAERCWANLNHAATSTSEKGPGSRLDSLNEVMHQWNWCKTTGMVTFLLSRWRESVKMSATQQEAFEAYSSEIPEALTSAWEKMDTKPKFVDGKWTSPFLMPETKALSLADKLKELELEETNAEHEALVTQQVTGAATWIVKGMEIEDQQKRLRVDIERWGRTPTPFQSLEITARRKHIADELHSHNQVAAHFVPDINSATRVSDTIGQPERNTVPLPSSFPRKTMTETRFARVKEQERELRRIACLRALRKIRAIVMQQVHLMDSKRKHTRGQRANTRAETMLQGLTDRLKHSRWLYAHSKQCLFYLGATDQDARTFRTLHTQEIIDLRVLLARKQELGDGYLKLPWYWRIAPSQNPDDETEINSSGHLLRQEFDESIRVEWFRARERARRWTEEVLWLKREMACVVLDFNQRGKLWANKASLLPHGGARAYAHRQEAMWLKLREDALIRGRILIEDSPLLISQKVLRMFPVSDV